MKLFVYSLKNILFWGEAVSLTCETQTGQITVLDNHEPLITALKEGLVKIIDNDKKSSYIQILNGFLEIRTGNEVRCIISEKEKE
ncbi:MAG: hypothetical protein HYT36_02905 [Candidatus Staskawiczbacteria bacterium]|nr:hypothetical protein [Candidatus Staskawiczbacteria bacterium]